MAWDPMKRLWSRDEGAQGNAQYVVNPAVAQEADEVWHNDTYQVLVRFRYPRDESLPTIKHLSIHAHDRQPKRDWRHFQQIKNEVCGEEATGMEIYPAESKLVDTANEYHLWVWPEDFQVGIGFAECLVSDDEVVDEFNLARVQGKHKGRQRPWEEGLTTGRSPASAEGRARAKEEFSGGQFTRS